MKKVAILMGSESDCEVVNRSMDYFKCSGISAETPGLANGSLYEKLVEFKKNECKLP